MVEKSQSKPRSTSDVKPISLQFSHPKDNLHFYIGPLGLHIADVAKSLEKCANDEEQLRVLRKDAEWVPRQIEMAEISAKGIGRWLRYGMMDAAGPFETRVRKVLGQLNTAYRHPEEFVENGNSCALFRQCHEEIAEIEIELCATPLDPNDDAKSMWPVVIAVFHHHLKNIATDLCSLAEKKRDSTDSIADLRRQIFVAIESLEDVLGSVQAQLADALHFADQYRWPIDYLPLHLKILAHGLPGGEPPFRAKMLDTWSHLRLLLAVLLISEKPAMSPDNHVRIWTEYPDDAKAMNLPAPTTAAANRPEQKISAESEAAKPSDLISISQASKKYDATHTTIQTYVREKKIATYRSPCGPPNRKHMISEAELRKHFGLRPTQLRNSGSHGPKKSP